MLEDKSILDKPDITKRESMIESVKPKRKGLRTFIWIVIIGALVYFLFKRAGGIEGVRDLANDFFGNLLN